MFSALVWEEEEWFLIPDRVHHIASTWELPFLHLYPPSNHAIFSIISAGFHPNTQVNLQQSTTIYIIQQKFVKFQ